MAVETLLRDFSTTSPQIVVHLSHSLLWCIGQSASEHIPVAASSVGFDWLAESSTPSTVASVGGAASGRASGAASGSRQNNVIHN
jgi:hypothetical protein